MARSVSIALVLNALLIGLGILGALVDAPAGVRVGEEWRVAAPLTFGCINVLAVRFGRRPRGMHGLAHLWSLSMFFFLPFLYLAGKQLLRPVPLQWTESIDPTWIEYADFALIGAANVSALFAVRFSRVFKPQLWLTVLVIPTQVMLLLVMASDRAERWLEELLYGPIPTDGVDRISWFIDHDAPRDHAFGWFLLIWIVYILVGAYRGIPKHSAFAERDAAA